MLHVLTPSFPTRRSSDLIGRAHDAVGPGQHPRIRIGAVAVVEPASRAGLHAALAQAGAHRHRRAPRGRSEEHTSELQSLMRISYAVFCLKKKKKKQQQQITAEMTSTNDIRQAIMN